MIFIYLRLPYRRQIRATDPGNLSLLDEVVDRAALELGGTAKWMEERVILVFKEEEGCAMLRAAEGLRSIALTLEQLAPLIHGFTLILDRIQGDLAEAARQLDEFWLDNAEDGTWATQAAADEAGRLLVLEDRDTPMRRVLDYAYSKSLLPPGWEGPNPGEALVATVLQELIALLEGDRRLLLLTGRRGWPLEVLDAALEGLPGGRPSVTRAGPGSESSPLAPFLDLARPEEEDDSEGALAARLIASNVCRRKHNPALLASYAKFLRMAFESKAARLETGWILFEDLDRFSPEALEVLSAVIEGGESKGQIGLPILVGTSSAQPRGIRSGLLNPLAAASPDPRSLAEAARRGAQAIEHPEVAPLLAGVARGEVFRLVLAMRIAWDRKEGGLLLIAEPELSTDRLLELVLEGLPREYRGWLRAMALAEDILDDDSLDEFLNAAGYRSGIRGLIASALDELGIVRAGPRPRIARPEVARWIEERGKEGEDIDRAFGMELRRLHARKKILPSLALHRRLILAKPDERGNPALFLDAAAADIGGGPSLDAEDILAPSRAFALCIPLLQSWTRDSGEEAALALEDFAAEASKEAPSSLAQAMLALSRSVDEFSRGTKRIEAASIRLATIRLHELEAPRAEAKAHRVLGLAALSTGHVSEGADYLANAVDIAAAIPDQLEAFFSSLAAAGASYAMGDIKRAGLRIEEAVAAARGAFRPDWSLGAEFAAARVDFELGRYGRAEDAFEAIAGRAAELGAEDARFRSTVWAARAAAWSGMGTRMRSRLSNRGEDAEASWFMAELASWEGDWNEALRLARQATGYIPRRDWRPVDALSWSSGFDLLEGPCLGPWPTSAFLEDQITAFEAFVRAMAEGDEESIVDLSTRSRSGKLAAYHPQAHLYDWFAFIACESMEHPPFDPETLLSRAWKALQTRTLKMEESALKNQFLEGNRWNREIVAAARARRLI